MKNIIFTGDLFLGGDLLHKSAKDIVQIKTFYEADKRIVNLEQPISDNKKVENKCTLFTDSNAIIQLKEMKIDAVNLAHNHIQDKGIEAICETIEHLKRGKVGYFGAGCHLKEAKKPYFITDEIAIFGYCEFGKPYLKQIEVATEEKPGINPLKYENILDDLNSLKENQKAILYFHWGREHVFLPPYQDIQLAKKLLEDDRVLLIVGMHPHRPQGYIKHNGKRAYMCLGNFLFPNFYIKPPTQIYYPENKLHNVDITRQYHSVFKVTYKKWKWINRVSIILNFDIKNQNVKHMFAIQDDNTPVVRELFGIKKFFMDKFIYFLSLTYKLPKFIYIPLEKTSTFITYKLWKFGIYRFWIRQIGFKEFLKKFWNKLKRKLK